MSLRGASRLRRDIANSIQGWAKTQPDIRKYSAQVGGGLYGGTLANIPLVMPETLSYAIPYAMDSAADPLDLEWEGISPLHWGASSSLAGVASIFSGHETRSRNGQGKQPAQPAPQPMDLLQEFDTGMKRVREWKFGVAEIMELD